LAHCGQLFQEELDAPHRRVVALVGVVASQLIVEDDRAPTICKLLKRFEVVVRFSRTAIEHKERELSRSWLGEVSNDAVPNEELSKRDETTHSKLGGSTITQLTYESGLEYERQEATSQVIAMLDDIADAVWTLSDKKMPPEKKEHVRALVRELQGIVRSLPPGVAGGLAGEIAARFVDGS
jgi:hypothetical protein